MIQISKLTFVEKTIVSSGLMLNLTVKSHCLIFMVAQESNECSSESSRYSKAIECSCLDKI